MVSLDKRGIQSRPTTSVSGTFQCGPTDLFTNRDVLTHKLIVVLGGVMVIVLATGPKGFADLNLAKSDVL